jgi:type IV pilus assembly protein PilB
VVIRAATLPTNHGERATLRLLAIEAESLTLANLGMAPHDLALVERDFARPHGLVLATGPTGCGKTTTLYAALRHIVAGKRVNAIAVQEPVEYDIPGVTQVEVDSSQKITFATALRSILRHDPDVIMVGEIRDRDTADIAIKAALTGHLVLATLHTNSAASAVTRLLDMGVEPFLVAAVLRSVVAQRLVRKLCPHCRAPAASSPGAAATPRAAAALGLDEAATARLREPRGCLWCAGRGYSGRSGLFEVLALDEELAAAVHRGAGEAELARAARARGQRSLCDDAVDKLLAGTTSLSEVLAAVEIDGGRT